MSVRGSLWLPLALLLLLAGLSFWIERAVQLPASRGQAAATDPEGIIENFDALRADLNGNPLYRLSARRLMHYSGNQLTRMDAPRFERLDAAVGAVSASAQHGLVSEDGSSVDLTGNVQLARAAVAAESALTLDTARLILYPDRNLLRAPGAVTLRDSGLDLRAGAMEYDTARRIIKLTGRVKARYIAGGNSGKIPGNS
jgi:lipopolysaccharide export system protein LptC